MGTNLAPLVADLFLFCYEMDFMMSLSDDKQADIIDAFNTTRIVQVPLISLNFIFLFFKKVSARWPTCCKTHVRCYALKNILQSSPLGSKTYSSPWPKLCTCVRLMKS